MYTFILFIVVGIISALILVIGINADWDWAKCTGAMGIMISACFIVTLGIIIYCNEQSEAEFIETTILVEQLNEESILLYTEQIAKCNEWLTYAKDTYLTTGERWSPIPDSVLLFKPIELEVHK